MEEKKMERLWTVEDVMEFSGLPRSTINLYIATSRIPSLKIGKHRRFVPEEIRKWIKRIAS
jgi:excisionase family DNA binding protein